MKPLISVVLPVLNGIRAGQGYLRDAIWSIVRQDYEGPIELIVVDDGSRDQTVKTVQEWAKKIHEGWQSRRIVVANRPHEGVTRSLNHGLRRATGEFIARQDADDWSDPSRFTRQVEYLKNNLDVAMVGSAVRVVHGKKIVDEVWYRRKEHRVPKQEFGQGSPFCHGSVMIRRKILDKVGEYDPQFPHAQDYDLFWRIAKHHAVASIPEPLYYYRVHGNRVTSNRRRFQIQLKCGRQIKRRVQRELKEI